MYILLGKLARKHAREHDRAQSCAIALRPPAPERAPERAPDLRTSPDRSASSSEEAGAKLAKDLLGQLGQKVVPARALCAALLKPWTPATA